MYILLIPQREEFKMSEPAVNQELSPLTKNHVMETCNWGENSQCAFLKLIDKQGIVYCAKNAGAAIHSAILANAATPFQKKPVIGCPGREGDVPLVQLTSKR